MRLSLLLLLINYFVSAQNWTVESVFPGGKRDDAVGFSIGNVGFVGSGRDDGFQYRRDFYCYENEQWKSIDPLIGIARQYSTSFSFSQSGCILTGIDANGSLLNENQCYDIVDTKWQIKTPFPGTARLQSVSFSVDGFGFCGQGRTSTQSFSDWYKYDVTTDSWSAISAFPNANYENISFTINGIGYVGLGKDLNGNYYDSFYAYNPISDSWSALANFPGNTRIYSIGFAQNGKGYVCTGQDENDVFTNEFWEYEPVEDLWTQLTSPPIIPNRGVAQFTVDNCSYIVSGLDSTYNRVDETWAFCSTKSTSTKIILFPNPASETVLLISTATSYEITNMNGTIIKSEMILNEETFIDVSKLAIGIYILKTIDNFGERLATKLVVKH